MDIYTRWSRFSFQARQVRTNPHLTSCNTQSRNMHAYNGRYEDGDPYIIPYHGELVYIMIGLP